jgi:hypothetical protein
MAVFQLDPKRRVWQKFYYDTWEFEQFFLGHVISCISLPPKAWRTAPKCARTRKFSRPNPHDMPVVTVLLR